MSKNDFDFSQFESYVNRFEKMQKQFDDWLKTFILQQAQRCIARTKQRQQRSGFVDTGFMINAWVVGNEAKVIKKGDDGKYKSDYASAFASKATIQDVTMGQGGNLQITLGNIAEYASYVELGHSTKSGGWVNGGFMFTISMDEIDRAMPTRFNNDFKNFLKKWGID